MSVQSKALEKKFIENFEHAVPDEKVRRILLNASEVFAKKGLAGTKIKDIAAKAGFSQGFVYNYFQSKDDIFTRLVDLAAEGAGISVKYASEQEGTPYEKIFWLTEALLSADSIAMQHWRLLMTQASSSEAVPEAAIKIAKEKAKLPFEHFIPMVADGQKAGEIADDPPIVLAVTYFSIVQGLALTRIQNGNGIPFPTTEMVLRFMRKER